MEYQGSYRDYLRPLRYDQTSTGIPGDVEFYLGLARKAAGPVLELGCGTGRVTIEIARAGIPIVGLDCEPNMIAAARRKSEGLANPFWVLGDMSDFALTRTFELVLIPYRSFQHLATDAKQRRALGCIRRHLRPGGRLAFDLTNPLIFASLRSLKLGRVTVDNAAPRLTPITCEQMSRMLAESGCEIERTLGSFLGAPFDFESQAMIWVARVREDS
jgi:SAM-dependent methyltransferase